MKKRFATVTPIIRVSFSETERSSRPADREPANEWDRIAIVPPGIKVPGYITCEFPRPWFRAPGKLQDLFLTRGFYEKFQDYEFILLARTEGSIPLTSKAESFFEFDYVARPCRRGTNAGGEPIFAGNGGGNLSLRRVSAFIRICARAQRWRRWKPIVARAWEDIDESYYWARRACLIDSSFRVAPDEVSSIFGQQLDGYERLAPPFSSGQPRGAVARFCSEKSRQSDSTIFLPGKRKPGFC